jgi:hypothetical protein
MGHAYECRISRKLKSTKLYEPCFEVDKIAERLFFIMRFKFLLGKQIFWGCGGRTRLPERERLQASGFTRIECKEHISGRG